MKSRKLKYLETVLRLMSVAVLKKYKPIIIGITGSMGKTSAKEAVYAALAVKYRVRKNIKNYNNEVGIPLTIIGAESGNRSPIKWLAVFFRWLGLVVFPREYPEILVLEMGVDRPGDMKYLLDFIPLDAGIVTSISPVHLEFFKDIEHIAREKGRIVEGLPREGFAILNADDKRTEALAAKTGSRVISYGFSGKAMIMASDPVRIKDENGISGISFKVNYAGKSLPVRLRHIIGRHQIYPALAAIAAGVAFKVNPVEVMKALENLAPPPGRLNVISGKKGSTIIDDTYNSSPAAAISALEIAASMGSSRRMAILGDMLELGQDEEKGHRAIARKIFELNFDFLAAVGERMKIAVRELERLNFPKDKIAQFDNPAAAGDFAAGKLERGDIVLVKGSQSMRMEKAVEKLMEEPGKARNVLCRQSAEWWKKPYIKP